MNTHLGLGTKGTSAIHTRPVLWGFPSKIGGQQEKEEECLSNWKGMEIMIGKGNQKPAEWQNLSSREVYPMPGDWSSLQMEPGTNTRNFWAATKKWATGWETEVGDIIQHFQRGQENEFWKWQAEDVESMLEETIFLLLKVFCLITRWNSNHWDPLGSPRKTLRWTGLMFSLAILLGWLAMKMQ